MRRPMLWVGGTLALGIAGQAMAPPWVWWVVAATGLTVAMLSRRALVLSTLAILVAIVGWGALLAAMDHRGLVARPLDGSRSIGFQTGLVVSDSTWRRAAGHPVLQQATVQLDDGRRIWLRHRQPAFPLRYGDRLLIRGAVRPPRPPETPAAFNEVRWTWLQHLDGLVDATGRDVEWIAPARGWRRAVRAVFDVKQQALMLVRPHMDPVAGGLVAALVAGERTSLPRPVTRLFERTGTVHLLSVSGWHVTIVGGVLWLLARAVLPGRGALAATMLGLLAYCVMTGAQSPIVRATIVGIMVLGGLWLRRSADPLNSIGLAASVIVLFSPRTLWAVDFQLSFASVAALLVFAPSGVRLGRQVLKPVPRLLRLPMWWCWQGITVTTAAWLGAWPLVAYHLHQVTPVAWLANLLAVPLAALLMMTSGVAIALVWLHPWLAAPWISATELVTHGLIGLLAWSAQLPGATVGCPPVPGWFLFGWYAGLVGIGWYISRIEYLINSSGMP